MRSIKGTRYRQKTKVFVQIGKRTFSYAPDEGFRSGIDGAPYSATAPTPYDMAPPGIYVAKEFRLLRFLGRFRETSLTAWRLWCRTFLYERGYYGARIELGFGIASISFPMPANAAWKAKCDKWAEGEFIGQVLEPQ